MTGRQRASHTARQGDRETERQREGQDLAVIVDADNAIGTAGRKDVEL
jgi:hypothetical protein